MHTTLQSYESQNCDKTCNLALLLAKTRGVRWKQFSLCSKHIICLHLLLLWTFEVLATCFNTRCQMAMPLPYCTCCDPIKKWEYCVYYISNVSL